MKISVNKEQLKLIIRNGDPNFAQHKDNDSYIG